jgi:putative heme degradation protein
MLNTSGPSLAPATRHRPTAVPLWDKTDDEAPAGSHVWALTPTWPAIVQAVLGLGPVTVRAGDGLCRIEHRSCLRWLGSTGNEWHAHPTARLSIDTSGWACGMATQVRLHDGRVRRGFAFFNDLGQPMLELDLACGASPDGFHGIVGRFSPETEPSDGQEEPASVHWPSPRSRPHTHGLRRLLTAGSGADALLEQLADRDLAQPLACEALLEVLRHARQSRLPMSVCFARRGLQLGWSGHLHRLDGRKGAAIASGFDVELQWSESPSGLQAWLLREPTASGLALSLALLAPDGELRMLLAPLQAPERPQPCAWRSSISAVCGNHCGSAC